MHPFFRRPSLPRLGHRPKDPAAIVARPRGTRRPHTDRTVAVVRDLIEQSTLTYGEIAQRTGVGRASICRWTRDGGWQRPLFAPRATDTVPTARASAHLKARTLAARLAALAERHIRELEESACVDPDRLGEALELMKMAKLAARVRRGRRRRSPRETPPLVIPAKPRKGAARAGTHLPSDVAESWVPDRAPRVRDDHREVSRSDPNATIQESQTHEPTVPEHHARTAMRKLRAAGVDTWRVPDDALEDFVASHAPPPARRRRGRRFTGDDYYARMLRKIDDKP